MNKFTSVLAVLLLLSGCGTAPSKPVQDAANATPEAALSPYQKMAKPVAADARRRFQRAQNLIAGRDWQAALLELQPLAEAYPELSGPLVNMAVAYQGLDNVDAAEQYYRKALQVNKLNLEAYNRYAIFLRRQGRFQEAEQYYLKALAVWDRDADSHKNLGILYELYMGRLADAQQQYQRYLALIEASHVAPYDAEIKSAHRQVSGWLIDIERRLAKES